MSALRTYGRGDTQPETQIKADWGQGVNTLLPGDRLPPMQFTHGLNLELREGYPVTRRGVARAKFFYRNGAPLGAVFQGAGLIQSSDPDPSRRLPIATLVVCDNNLWLCAPNNEPTRLKAGITDALQPVQVIDAFDEALILRNLGQPPVLYRYEAGQGVRDLPAPRAGMTTLPPAETGCYAGNRVWLKLGKSEVVASDIFEWDYLGVETRWMIDDGENDEIVRLWPVGENRIVVFKTRSVHVIENVSALDTVSEPAIQIDIRRLAAARGCVSPWAIAQRGQTLFYLSREGVEALVLSESGISAMSDKPLSGAVQRYFEEVRWRAVRGAQMAVADNYLLLSVPTRWGERDYAAAIYDGTLLGRAPAAWPAAAFTGKVCGLTHTTYSGSGTWCGFKGFFTFNEGITPRYLTKTVRGENRYFNSWPWGDGSINPLIHLEIRQWVLGLDPLFPAPQGNPAPSGMQTFWLGQASYDPANGCALANGINVTRRTNGHPHAFIMAYGHGPELETMLAPNPLDIWAGWGFYGNIVHGYNTVVIEGEAIRNFTALGLTAYGNQLGSHTVYGLVREALGNEHTLFAQLVISGGQVTATRQSELTSYNDATGAFAGTVSAFTFTKPAGLNATGKRYTVRYRITVTTGIVVEEREEAVEYAGTGIAAEQHTVPLPVILGAVTAFDGECITITETRESWDDFEHLADTQFTETLGEAPGWAAVGDLSCGTGISADDFEEAFMVLNPGQTEVIVTSLETGYCWLGPMDATSPAELEAWDDFEDYLAGSYQVIQNKGFGWVGYGDVFTVDNPGGSDDFESYALGVLVNMDFNPGWVGFGDMGTHALDAVANDDFESYALGAFTVMNGGENWTGNGDIYTY